MASSGRPQWPRGKPFAFTIFDDPDSQTFQAGREVYALLKDLGFRTTKGVWPLRPTGTPSDHGITCGDDPHYIEWLQQLQACGFEIGYHNATSHTSRREQTIAGLDEFARYFGGYPRSMANHYFCDESMYWGDQRLTGRRRLFYNLLTRGRSHNRFFGHVPGHPYFWGDLCKQRIRYVRNFTFAQIDTLQACPFMPYHDPLRPCVNYWYAGSEGANVNSFIECIQQANQERLEEAGGACIMYTHFGHGFFQDGKLDRRFRQSMERLARRNGWYVPVSALLDHLLAARDESVITDAERARLERRWLLHKVRLGTA